MNKGVLIAIGILVVASLAYFVAGMSDGTKPGSGDEAATEAGAARQAGSVGTASEKAAPKVTKENEQAELPKEEAKDLKLPGRDEFKKLDLPELPVTALPAKPHSEMKVEGDLQEVDAELAFRSVFPRIRSCYVELRQHAPQAKGRMLMRIRVSKGEEGKGHMGELYLKETQFTDPKYLTCIREAIDNTKFKIDKSSMNGTMEFTMFLTPEDVANHEKEAGAAAATK